MVRQCAWCLCLINSAGERLSPFPVPKLYEASHGICDICGVQWMEQVIAADNAQSTSQRHKVDAMDAKGSKILQELGSPEVIVQMVLQLQERSSEASRSSLPLPSTKLPIR
jgi:hypothetical protein